MQCVLCGNSTFQIITNKLRFNISRKVVKCNNCSLISLEDPTMDVMDYSGSEYRTLHTFVLGKSQTAQEFFEMSLPFMQDRIQRVQTLLTSDANVLEIGSSTGHFLYSIKNKVAKTIGIELDHNYATFSREHCKLEVYETPLEKINFPDRYFDVIFMFQVFEHIQNPLEILTLCKKYLKSNGTIYLEVPNVNDALLTLYEIPSFQQFYYRKPHTYYYSDETLVRMLSKAGFVGYTTQLQEYTFFNHIHWLLTGTPQSNYIDARNEPKFCCSDSKKKKYESLIKKWFKKIDNEYKELLEKFGLAENICYRGKIKSI